MSLYALHFLMEGIVIGNNYRTIFNREPFYFEVINV